MIAFARAGDGLTATGIRARAALVGVVLMAAWLLRVVDPTTLSAIGWMRTSCGAVTGLPCIFCGMTRAFHHLLLGDLGRALYFNWLVLPAAIAMVVVVFIAATESLLRRRLIRVTPSFRLTRRFATVASVIVLALWTFQVWLAVSGHKSELLNPRGPLYGLIVR